MSGGVTGYLPIGYPDLSTSIQAAVALVEGGVEALELGIPYSDPVIDGPVVEEAGRIALERGFRLRQVFEAVTSVREQVDAPIYVMTYWNPVLQYGVDRFAEDFAEAGGTGLITPDITPEAAGDWIAASDRTGLDRVFLAAPTSTDERLRMIAGASRGWVYAVSTMGVTGTRDTLDSAARRLVERLRHADAPEIRVGIGVSSRAQVEEVLTYADGAIVGSAIVRALTSDGIAGVRRFAEELTGR